jgi:ribose 5-phosphate isomerase B
MKIVIGADHGGFALKGIIAHFLSAKGYEVVDAGAFAHEPSDDYPDFARDLTPDFVMSYQIMII